MRKPRVGDTVIYRHRSTKDSSLPPHESPATVLKIHEDGTVDLFVMLVMGGSVNRFNIEQGKGEYQWSWPDAEEESAQ